MGYKLKRITIRPNGTEQQIRPKGGWQPGANTLAYRPLTSTTTTTDQMGNYNLTNNSMTFGTYQGVDCVYGTDEMQWLSYTSFPGSNIRTVSIWTNWSGTYTDYWSGNSVLLCDNGFAIRYNKDGGQGNVFLVNDVNTGTYKTNERFNVVATVEGGVLEAYINGVSVGTGGAIPSDGVFDLGRFNFSGSTIDGYAGGISEVILETVAWTPTEVVNYFNSTKGNYGL